LSTSYDDEKLVDGENVERNVEVVEAAEAAEAAEVVEELLE